MLLRDAVYMRTKLSRGKRKKKKGFLSQQRSGKKYLSFVSNFSPFLLRFSIVQ